ncbi:unnamed protein product [Cylicocyclus nassatus]|uniref:Uncharacterized protein n=1 Tax=Cylicocyclus nassatus TaxID=53992 RepID=A0AA36DQT1_CYLNA|nr:unnamed protein product [Cylicocyclus nassatus]
MVSEPKNERSLLNYTAMHMSLSKYFEKFDCLQDKSLNCEKNADIRVPNEMVRLRLRSKADLRDQKAKPSQFEYIYQKCSAKSTTAKILDITVQYRFDRRSSYSIIYPPMIRPGGGRCSSRRNLFAYCRCLYKEKTKL